MLVDDMIDVRADDLIGDILRLRVAFRSDLIIRHSVHVIRDLKEDKHIQCRSRMNRQRTSAILHGEPVYPLLQRH